jgi:uncharacterized protein YutE (UPF0331/DUF86 family)
VVDRAVIKTKLAFADTRLQELKFHSRVSLGRFRNDSTLQAAILHHLQVGVQSCMDIASHVIADEGWGVPGTSKDLFEFLRQHRVISLTLAKEMKDVVGFRNLVVHAYDKLDLRKAHAHLPAYRRALARFLKAVVVYAKI